MTTRPNPHAELVTVLRQVLFELCCFAGALQISPDMRQAQHPVCSPLQQEASAQHAAARPLPVSLVQVQIEL